MTQSQGAPRPTGTSARSNQPYTANTISPIGPMLLAHALASRLSPYLARPLASLSLGQLAKSWIVSYIGNFVGSIAFAYLVFLGGTLGPAGGASVAVAGAKTSLTFTQAFVRGLLCNWLVCMAVYVQSFAKDMVGKMTAIWFLISAFVALGLEHSVANMFIIPLGIMSGAAVSMQSPCISLLPGLAD